MIGNGLLPSGHFEELFALGCGEGDVGAGRGAIEELCDVELGTEGRMRGGMVRSCGGFRP